VDWHCASLVQLPQAMPPELLPLLLPELLPELLPVSPELLPELPPVMPELLPEPPPELLPELLPELDPVSSPASLPKSWRFWLESPDPQAATRAKEKTIALIEPSFMGALPSVDLCGTASPANPQQPSAYLYRVYRNVLDESLAKRE
jgi:hypothetical protein